MGILTQRRAELQQQADSDAQVEADNLLDALIKARDEDSQLSDEQITDNIIGLFFGTALNHQNRLKSNSHIVFSSSGSFETTAATLGFLCDYLAQNPSVQQKAFEEATQLADDFETWTDQKKILAAVDSLKYLDFCIKETQRMMPVAPGFSRTITADLKLADYHLCKGTNVLINNIILCRDPKLWRTTKEDANSFRPERWETIDVTDLKHTYLPFGFGGRMCIGFRIANMEMKTVIASFLRAFKILPDPKKTQGVYGDMTMKPDYCSVFLERRQ